MLADVLARVYNTHYLIYLTLVYYTLVILFKLLAFYDFLFYVWSIEVQNVNTTSNYNTIKYFRNFGNNAVFLPSSSYDKLLTILDLHQFKYYNEFYYFRLSSIATLHL